jgi:hypothetical protein
MAASRASTDKAQGLPATTGHSDKDINQVERVFSVGDEKGDHVNYERIDQEVAQYASETEIYISEEENKRLKRLIDRRVLPIMVFTYFLQALDKGTMSMTSIMGIRDDIPVLQSKQTVSYKAFQNLQNAQLTCDSLGGSPRVFTSLCSLSNTPQIGSSKESQSPNTLVSIFLHGVPYWPVILSASAFHHSWPSEHCLVSLRQSVSLLSSS